MKSRNAWKGAFFLTTLIFAQSVSAVTPAEETEKKCIKPKFRDFVPEHLSEVAPESTISFHVNRIGDPNHIRATAKKIPMKVEVIDKGTFYFATAKLPEELKQGFARIHIEAGSVEGDCIGQDGWLIKIKAGGDEEGVSSQKADQAASAAGEKTE